MYIICSPLTISHNGDNILDIDEFTGDGSTVDFLTNIRFTENMSSLITIDGKQIEHVLVKSDSSYIAPGNVVISFASPPAMDAKIRFCCSIFLNDRWFCSNGKHLR